MYVFFSFYTMEPCGRCPGGQSMLRVYVFAVEERFQPSVMGASFLGPCLREIYAPTAGQSPDMVATDILHMRVADTLK